MFAVIKTGGKQYRLSVGEKLKIEQIAAEPGQTIALTDVLAVGSGESITLGTPIVGGATVNAMVLSHGRADKVRIFKMRRRKHYQKRQGHRQWFTEIFISEIAFGTESAKATVPDRANLTHTGNSQDNLVLIEGIGTKIASILNGVGIYTFAQLADTPVARLKDILKAAGSRFSIHNPTTWPNQAALARDGKLDELKAWQDANIASKS